MEEEMEKSKPKDPHRVDAVARSYSLGIIVALLMMVSFVAGAFIGNLRPATATDIEGHEAQLINRDAVPPYHLQDVDFSRFWEVWNMVKERYAGDPPSDIDLFYGATRGLVSSLEDPYSLFFDPQVADEFIRELEGMFEGIGTEIGIKQNQLTAIAPLPDTPAERAGLRAKDKILMIDDEDTYGMSLEEAVKRIRGPKGTEVRLLVFREGVDEPFEIPIIRDTIVVDSVRVAFEEKDGATIGVITISQFNESTAGAFSDAVQDVLLKDADGLIIDLRNNPGGFLETAVQVAGEWAPRSVIVAERFSDDSRHNYTSDGNARLVDMPTVVLVNGGSASASEIVAGALQDYHKAYILGEQTFGKGSVQDFVEFDDGSALKLTIARWLTPDGRTINDQGITPDEVVEFTFEDYDNDLDPQFDRALEVLSHPETRLEPQPADEADPGV